jgi:hypothetical protein
MAEPQIGVGTMARIEVKASQANEKAQSKTIGLFSDLLMAIFQMPIEELNGLLNRLTDEVGVAISVTCIRKNHQFGFDARFP